jgi:hypothetical protein
MIHLQEIITFCPNFVTEDYADSANLKTDIEYMAPDETY